MATYTDEVLVLSSGLTTQMGATDQLSFSTSIIVADGKGLQGLNATSDVAVTLGDAAGATNFIVEDSSNVNQMVVDSDGNVAITGNLDVSGNIISRDEERVLVADNFLDINFGYSTVTALEGGIAVNYLPVAGGLTINTTANTLTFSAQAGATNPKVVASTASGIPNATFAAGDIIQIAGTTNAENDGFYVVLTNTLGQIEIEDVNDSISFKAAQVNFTAEAETTSTAVTIFQVNVNILQTSASGAWQVQNGKTDAEFATFTPLGTSTLQQAYDAGQSITTTNDDGPIVLTFDTDSAGLTADGDAAGVGDVTFGATTTIGKFTVDSTDIISFDTTGAVNLTSSAGAASLVGGTTATVTAASGSALTLNDGAGTLVMTSGSLSETSLVNTTLTGSGTMTLTGGGLSKFGDDTGTIDFDGDGAVSDTSVTDYNWTPSATYAVTAGSTLALASTTTASLTGGTTLALASTSGSQASFTDGVATLAATSGATAWSAVTSYDLQASAAVTIDSSASTIAIGGDANTGAIGIGGAGARTVTVGNDSATKVIVNAKSAADGIDLQVAGTSFVKVDGTNSKVSALRSLSFDTASTTAAPTQAISVALTAGEAIDKGEIVYLSAAKTVSLGDANSGSAGAAIRTPIGIAIANIANSAVGGIGVGGILPCYFNVDADGNAVGKPVYLDTTNPGFGVQNPPTVGTVFQIGVLVAASSSNLGLVLWQPVKIADQA